MELTLGRDLLILGLLVASVLTLMWALAATRRSSR